MDSKMKCEHCNTDFGDILKHRRKSKVCQPAYDMDALVKERKLLRLKKQRSSMKLLHEKKKEKVLLERKYYHEHNKETILKKKRENYKEGKESILEQRKERYEEKREIILEQNKEYYEQNREKILDQKIEYYEEKKEKILDHKKEYYKEKRKEILCQKKEYYVQNKDDICKNRAASYKKSRPLICQRQRFKRYLTEKVTFSYLSQQQQHLYHHTTGFCQPETMKFLNHSIEFYDGVCHSCGEKTAVKIVGVNRLVCLSCNKAHCKLCLAEVSSNPEEGCFHYWPPGACLDFLPGFCPLYSIYPADYSSVNSIDNKKDCRICEDAKSRYPEYELFSETLKTDLNTYREREVLFYICSFCYTRFNFVCEFDQHMRSHTKYVQQVAIVGFIAKINERVKRGHVKEETFSLLEKEFMKVEGVFAVLTILWKNHMEEYFEKDCLKDIDLGAALLIQPGIDIKDKISVEWNLIRRVKVLVVKPHWSPDEAYAEVDHKIKRFHKLMCWVKPRRDLYDYPTELIDRNRALLTARCSLMYPADRYKTICFKTLL